MFRKNLFLYDIKSIPNYTEILVCASLILVLCVLAAAMSTFPILRMQPALAMRPQSPPSGKTIFIEKITSIWNSIPAYMQMGLRNLFRNSKRNIMVALGMCFSFALISVVLAINISNDRYISVEMPKVNQYDIKAALSDKNRFSATEDVFSQYSDIDDIEPISEMDVSIGNQDRQETLQMLVLPSDNMLYGIYGKDGEKKAIPESGIMITSRLADYLNADLGSDIYIEDMSTGRKYKTTVSSICRQYYGDAVLISEDSYKQVFGTQSLANYVLIKAKPNSAKSLISQMKSDENVQSVMDMETFYKEYSDNNASTVLMFRLISLIGVIVGMLILNSAIFISISERKYELATLRVIGMSIREVSAVILFEFVLLLLPGILFGIPLTDILFKVLINVSSTGHTNDLVRTLPASSLLFGVLGLMVSLMLSYAFSYFKTKKLALGNEIKIYE